MKEIIAYEMIYNKALKYQNDIICVPFHRRKKCPPCCNQDGRLSLRGK